MSAAHAAHAVNKRRSDLEWMVVAALSLAIMGIVGGAVWKDALHGDEQAHGDHANANANDAGEGSDAHVPSIAAEGGASEAGDADQDKDEEAPSPDDAPDDDKDGAVTLDTIFAELQGDPAEVAGAQEIDAAQGDGAALANDPWKVEPMQASPAQYAEYLQQIDRPTQPNLNGARQVVVHTMRELQEAVRSRASIQVVGRLIAASEGDFVKLQGVQDVTIRFAPGAEIRYNGGKSHAGVFRIFPGCKRIRFENVHITGPLHTRDTCNGIEFVHGGDAAPFVEDVTIMGAEMRGVSYAVQMHAGAQRVLIQDCSMGDLMAYFVFGARNLEDVTIERNTVRGSVGEHNIRIFDANGMNIVDNDLMVQHRHDGQMKRTMWILTGQDVTIAGNTTRDGRISLGPSKLAHQSTPQDRLRNVNVVFNRINHIATNSPLEISSGAEDLLFAGNVVTTPVDHWLSFGGANEHRRPITNARWKGVTIFNGREVSEWDGVRVEEGFAEPPQLGPMAADVGE